MDKDTRPYGTIINKVGTAQRSVRSVRIIILLVCTAGYMAATHKGTIPWLAYTLLGVAWVYGIYLIIQKPNSKYAALSNSAVMYLLDGVLITLWILATGGYLSTYFIIWYVAIAAVAYRQNMSTTMLVAFLYALLYALLMMTVDKLLPDVVVRCAFIFIAGYLVQKVTHSQYLQTQESVTIKEMMAGMQQTDTLLAEIKTELTQLQENFETQVNQRTAEIVEQSMFYKKLLDALPAIAWTTDANGRMTYVNKVFDDFVQIETSKLIPEKYIAPKDIKKTKAAWQAAQQNGQDFSVEHRWIDHEGNTVWMASHVAPLKNENGTATLWAGVAIDISEQKRALNEKDTHTGIIAQEIKSPVAGIKEYTQLAKKALDSEEVEGAKIFVSRTSAYINNAEQLINELTDVYKIQTGRMTLNYSEFEVAGLAESVVNRERHTYPTLNFQFVKGAAMFVQADKQRVEQVLQILLTNAIVRTTDVKDIRIAMESRKNILQISITDKGAQILEEQQKKIFTVFYKETDNAGLGVNLFIAKEIAVQHQGDICCESNSIGTTFIFTLPIKQTE